MKFTVDDLVAQGIGEDLATQIVASYTAGVEEALAAEKSNSEKLQADVATLENQVAQLKVFEGTNEELKQKIQTLEAERETSAKKLAIQSKLSGQVHDIELTMGLLDLSKVDGALSGLDTQIETLKTSKPFLFTDTNTANSSGVQIVGQGQPLGAPTGSQQKSSELKTVDIGKSLAQAKLKSLKAQSDAEKHYF